MATEPALAASGSNGPSFWGDADRSTRFIIVAIGVVGFAILMLALYVVAAGVVTRPAPRTMVEREIDMLGTIAAAKPKIVKVWADYARALIVGGQYSRAAAVLTQGEGKVGKQPDLTLERARLAYAQGDRQKALDYLAVASKQALDFRASEQKRLIQKGVQQSPKLTNGHLLAQIYLMQAQIEGSLGQWPAVVASLTKGLAEEGTSSDSLVMRGQAYLKLGDKTKAIADFKTALKYIPNYGPAVQGLKDAGGN